MGRRGPPPKPTALRLLNGNAGKRAINEHEPKPDVEEPKPPLWLTKAAREEWDRLMPKLLQLGIISQLDRACFAAYCQSWANYSEAQKKIRRFGHTFTTDKGYIGIRPEVTIAQRERTLLRQFMQELGLSPSARSRVTTKPMGGKPKGAGDKESKYFGGGNKA